MKRKSNQPLVSVIIPVFNGTPYLLDAVKSTLKSTYKNIEIILVDDGSSDQSKLLCQKLADKYPKVRFYAFTKNQGQGEAINYALKKAKGKYICRLNQDDTMLPHRIATQVKYLAKHPKVVALGSSILLFDEQGHSQLVNFLENDAEIKKVWHILSPFSDPSVMFNRQVALKVGGHDQAFYPANDTHLWIRMGQVGQLANIRQPLVHVLYHSKCASVKRFKALTKVTWKMHLWMDRQISPAPWYVKLFWSGEYLSGRLFSANFNWAVYRLIKKLVYFISVLADRFHRFNSKPAVNPVMVQPTILNISGQ